MAKLTKGGNTALSGDEINVAIRWRNGDSRISEVDASAFLLGVTGKVSSDADMVFYGQRRAFDSVVLHAIGTPEPDGARTTTFSLGLRQIPTKVDKIIFTATIDDGVKRGLSFGLIPSLSVLVFDEGAIAAEFEVPTVGATECALIVGEVYRRNGQWKFRAVGQGFNGGLKPLAELYGVDIANDTARTPPSPVAPTLLAPMASPPPSPQVILTKITLDKAKPSVDLTKKGASFGKIEVNLNWNRGPEKKTGFFGRKRSPGVDLDLGCLFELQNGAKGVVQALGNGFGRFDHEPYIQLSGDDRTGANADGEWLRINGKEWTKIKRVLIFAFIYDGVPDWNATDGVITLFVPDSPPVEVRLDAGSRGGMCAIALIENVGGQMRVNREVQYFNGHQLTDRAYGWGLRWTAGSKG